MIKDWIESEEPLWSNLEKRLGDKLENVDEDTLSQFYQDKIELDVLLAEYLENEQDRFLITDDNKNEIESEFGRSLRELTKGFKEADVLSITKTKEAYKNEEYYYQFIYLFVSTIRMF